jgi:hypothetical protein
MKRLQYLEIYADYTSSAFFEKNTKLCLLTRIMLKIMLAQSAMLDLQLFIDINKNVWYQHCGGYVL